MIILNIFGGCHDSKCCSKIQNGCPSGGPSEAKSCHIIPCCRGRNPPEYPLKVAKCVRDCAIDYSNVKRWVRRVKESEEVGKASVVDLPKSGRPATPGRWVPKKLTDGHRTARVDSCTELLQEYQSDPTFLQRIITGDETWVHHYESESKRRSME